MDSLIRLFLITAWSSAITHFCACDVRFLVVGDWGNDNDRQLEVASGMATWCLTNRCDFVMTTGDNFYPNGIDDGLCETSPRFNISWRNIYMQHESLKDLVWYISVGNHDHFLFDAEWCQVYYGEIEPQWYFPNLTYSFYKEISPSHRIHFIAIDSESLFFRKNNASEQLAFFESELQSSTAQWKVVFGHHPPYSSGEYWGNPTTKNEVVPLMLQYGAHVSFWGHDHNLQHINKIAMPDIDYIISGSGAKLYEFRNISYEIITDEGMQLNHFSSIGGFSYVIVEEEYMTINLISYIPEILYTYQRPRVRVN